MRGAILDRVDLTGANLSFADFMEADLSEVNLSGANMRTAVGLTQEQLDEACGDRQTQLPLGLTIKPCPQDSTTNASER
jgi:hypothetical protein